MTTSIFSVNVAIANGITNKTIVYKMIVVLLIVFRSSLGYIVSIMLSLRGIKLNAAPLTIDNMNSIRPTSMGMDPS